MDLNELRKNIDEIDAEVVRLLNLRYEYVQGVGQWMQSTAHEIYVPGRERALIEKLYSINEGLLPNKTLKAVYREIMSGAIALEHPVTIAFLGPENTFSHQAAVSKFGHSVKYIPQNSIADVFEAVEKSNVSYGVVPVENSTEGAVTYTLDLLAKSSNLICAELNVAVHHQLMTLDPNEEIKVIYSHPQAIGQCRTYLHNQYPKAAVVEVNSTADAARRASEEKGSAAIASAMAAESFGLTLLDTDIEDKADNVTRFLVIGKQEPKQTGEDKTSLVFTLPDRVGSLYDALGILQKNAINLSMVESRPTKERKGEYVFFVDFLGHKKDEGIQKAIADLQGFCSSVKILGSYPVSI